MNWEFNSLKDAAFNSKFIDTGLMKPIKHKYKIDFGKLKYFSSDSGIMQGRQANYTRLIVNSLNNICW